MNSKKIAYIGLLCALAVLLGYIESLFPPVIPIVGFKVGLANVAVMLTLCKFGAKDAFFVMLVKVLAVCLWFSGLNALIFSLSGGVMSLVAMCAAKKIGMSGVGVGMCGGVLHNVAQLAAAAVVMRGSRVLYLAPPLIILGLAAGLFVGVSTAALLRYIK